MATKKTIKLKGDVNIPEGATLNGNGNTYEQKPEELKVVSETTGTQTPESDPKIEISKSQLDAIMGKLKMLEAVADKGRLYNYETSQKSDKKPMRIKLSLFGGGIITGWRMAKDIPVFHPQTGAQVGEQQEVEVMILDNEGNIKLNTFNSYKAFTDARYADRIEAEVIGKSTSFDDKVTFDVKLPDGRVIKLDSAFVN